MKSWFVDDQFHLRNGWKTIAFFFAVALVVGPLLFLLRAMPVETRGYIPKAAILAFGVLAATWICTRAERGSLAGIGLKLDARFAKHLLIGLSTGLFTLLLVASLVWLCGGFRLEEAQGDLSSLLKGAGFALSLALMEELIYRGYAFQRAIRGMGIAAAQVVFAVLFCASHPLDQGMNVSSMLCAIANLFLLALIAGFCCARTSSLAIPIGAHATWNWAQQSLGFGVSGSDSHGWWSPVFRGKPDWLSGGAFGLEASAIALPVLASIATLLAFNSKRSNWFPTRTRSRKAI